MYKYLILKIPLVSPSYITKIMHSQLARSVFFIFFLQATRDTFLNWGLHLCAPTFVHLFSCELSSVHISAGNIAVHSCVLPPNTDEGKMNTGESLVITIPLESFKKLLIWLGKFPSPSKETTRSFYSLAWDDKTQFAHNCPAALNWNTCPNSH